MNRYLKKPLALLILLTGLLAGCLHPALPPPTALDFSRIDTTPLRGKTIVIDPGHGGPERGAIGVRGLNESEVNLGVALSLWGLLKRAGANPILTRSSDTGVTDSEPLDIKPELEERSRISNSQQADLFVSIHHNAAENRRRNNMIIFFKMTDTGPSMDIAESLCRTLSRSLNAESARIQPGNYHVLRNTQAPAILGEASFISNKKNEARLAYARTLSTEAAAYFMGILQYYRKGVPGVCDAYPKALRLQTRRMAITARLLPGLDNASIVPSSVKVTLNGKRITYFSLLDNGTLSFVPRDALGNGPHRFCVTARATNGNSSGRSCASFEVAVPPRHMTARPVFPVIPASELSSTPIEIEVLDKFRRPVIDGTPVFLSATGGSFLDTTVTTRDGRARAIFTAEDKKRTVTVRARAEGASAQCKVRFGVPQAALFMATVRDPRGSPVSGVRLLRSGRPDALSDTSGFIYASLDAVTATACTITKAGYHPFDFTPALAAGKMTAENLMLEPIDGGAFLGRKIFLDPGSPSGRELPVLRELKKRIDHAGGHAMLTWQSPPAPSKRAKVLETIKQSADGFFSVSISKRSLMTEHYHKSKPGRLLAELVSARLTDSRLFGKKKCPAAPTVDYLVIHTPMPAVLLTLPRAALKNPGRVADCLYGAFLEWFSRKEKGRG